MVKIDIEARSVSLRTYYEKDAEGNTTDKPRKHTITGKDEHGQPFSLKIPVGTVGLDELIKRFTEEGAREAREAALSVLDDARDQTRALIKELLGVNRDARRAIRAGYHHLDDDPGETGAVAVEPASEETGDTGEEEGPGEAPPAEGAQEGLTATA